MTDGRAETVKCWASKFRKLSASTKQVLALCVVLVSALFSGGCAGLANSNQASPQAASLAVSPAAVNFGKVTTGSKASQTLSVTNSGKASVSIQQASSSNPQFTVSGATFPMALAAGQSTHLTVSLNSTTAGSVSGTLTLQANSGTPSQVVSLTGTVLSPQPQLAVSGAALNFGSVSVGSKSTLSLGLSNTGGSDLTVSMITLNGAEFTISGIATPKTIPAGQSVSTTVTFAPTIAGNASGSIAITSNDPAQPTSTISLAGSGTTVTTGTLGANPGSVAFGSVATGSSATQNVVLTNSGSAAVQISSVAATGNGFSVGGVTVPLTLNPAQTATLAVKFAPTAAGGSTGSVTVTSNASGSPLAIALSGTGTQPGLSISPASFSFGSVVDGQTKSQAFTLTNSGTASLTISQLAIAGAGYSVSGLTTPAILSPGQSKSFSATFAPVSAGTLNGAITVSSNAPNSPQTATLSGTGLTASVTMSASPASLSFAIVKVGTSSSQNLTIANSGNTDLTISQINVNATDFAAGGISLPFTLAAGKSSALSVTFSPKSSETVTGSVTFATTQGASSVVPVSGSGVQPALSLTPSAVSFGNVTLGSTNSQTIQISNTGSAALSVAQVSVTGTGFSTSALTLPISLNPGQSGTFNVQFSPAATGAATGSISIVSNAPNSPAVLSLSGSGVSATQTLSFSTKSLSFSNVATGTSSSQSVVVTNTGNADVSISQIGVSGSGFSLSGASTPVTLTPGQSLSFSVIFSPSTTGTVSGAVTVGSNASGSPVTITLSASGVSTATHSVTLTWLASTSTVAGYNVYRSTTSGSGYAKLNGSAIGVLSYLDASVQSATTYYYVTTAVDASGIESGYSNEVRAVIP